MGTVNHKAEVIRIGDMRKHPNADSLSIIDVDGYQVVVKTDQFKRGDLAVHIQPDSVVPATKPFAFIWGDEEFEGEVPEKKRRVTVRRFRGEYSEGLLLSLDDFVPDVLARVEVSAIGPTEYQFVYDLMAGAKTAAVINPGHDLADILGITHYNPPEPTDDGTNEKPMVRSKTLKGLIYRLLRRLTHGRWPAFYTETEKIVDSFRPEYDVEAFKKFPRALVEGEDVLITEKIHGSNARYTFQGDRMYVGTRKTWKTLNSNNVWTRVLKEFPVIEDFCRQHPGYTVYGEVVPTQKGYSYGFTSEHPGFFMFDTLRPDGTFVNFFNVSSELVDENPSPLGHSFYRIPRVPVLFRGPFFAERAKRLAEGPSTVQGDEAPGLRPMREGCVIRPLLYERFTRGLGRVHLKIVSNKFLEKDSK